MGLLIKSQIFAKQLQLQHWNNEDIKFLLAYIKKIYNILESEILTIEKIVSIIKATINKKSNVNIKKIWILK